MKELSLYDASAPIACSITDDETSERLGFFEEMRNVLDGLERTSHGMLLSFPSGEALEAQLRRFALDEKRCCQFWGFEVTSGPQALMLRWDAPPAAQHLIDRLEEFFTGDEPASRLRSLV